MFSLISPVLLQIWQARMQIFPRSLRQFEAPIGNPVKDAKDDDERIRIQDFVVDGWRFSDWAITLPLLVLELWLLASDANPTDEAAPLFIEEGAPGKRSLRFEWTPPETDGPDGPVLPVLKYVVQVYDPKCDRHLNIATLE